MAAFSLLTPPLSSWIDKLSERLLTNKTQVINQAIVELFEKKINLKKYNISMLPDGSIWIVNKFDEGMGVRKEEFEKLIDKFFKEKF